MALTLTPRAAHSLAERLGEPGDAGLGGGVARDVDAALEAEQGGGEDHLPRAAARASTRPTACVSTNWADEVHLEHAVPQVEGVFGGRLPLDRPGVVDQDVDGWSALARRAPRALTARAVGEVRPARREGAALGRAPPGHGASSSLQVGADADDVGAGVGQRKGHGHADAAPGAGDDGGLSGQVEQVSSRSRLHVDEDLHLLPLAQAFERVSHLCQRHHGGDQYVGRDGALG